MYSQEGTKHQEVVNSIQSDILADRWLHPSAYTIISFKSNYMWLCGECSKPYHAIAAIYNKLLNEEVLKAKAGIDTTLPARIYDGWCVYSAIRFECELSDLSALELEQIPHWDYGPAKSDCPYPILGCGTGLEPLYRFTTDIYPSEVVVRLVRGVTLV